MPSSLQDLLAALVRIDSINPSLVPGAAGEAELATFIATWLHNHGIEATVDEAAPGRLSVIATVRGTGGGRSLLLNAHLDTVGTEHMPLALDPVVRDGRMYGRGTYDMKGGLAACLFALLDARDAHLRGDVILAAVADEEHASLGMQSVLKSVRADAAIVTEPTSLQLCVAHKGFIWHEVTTHGRAAHGSRPDLGRDAIAHMGRVLGRLESLQRELDAREPHPLLGHASVHASLITGGQELSSYPERCTLQVERRTLPGETRAGAEQEWAELLGELALDPDFHAEHRITLLREPFGISHKAEIVQVLREQASEILGTAPDHIGQTFWMDAAFLAGAGIPTVVFGPHGAGAHATEEWVDLESVQHCRAVLSATLRAFCA
ncbi:acetylornithine deacetylase [Deinococcus malanensis]|uniref:Acetylornithine deacetylase n=1 Tax=Deinococcus malanensis TaxID=1706855 RepID=A0ABQ2F2I0_9DEIO|nr:M20/M25/M40 family metallo-hydrolase [Deinococcus malanensis]GGK33295.1 acetylornithine deacetylase [Deinococcus malanensis]